jgi:hypothetical protein
MIRRLAIGLVCLGACARAVPAQAAPSSFTVSGARAKACSLSATSVGMTAADVNHVVTVTFSPASVTAWCNAAGTLSVSSTRIRKGTTNTYKGYTLSVTGWGSAMTYVTTATVEPAPTTQASTAALSTTLSYACSAGCTDQALGNNTTWSATITLALTPN